MTIENIKNHLVYKQVMSDSFGGIMYTEGTHTKYDSEEVLAMWDALPESVQGASGGIMKGAISFLKGEQKNVY